MNLHYCLSLEMNSTDNLKHVRMPWNDSTSIIYQNNLYTKWNLIKELLSCCIPDVDSLVNVIRNYNVLFSENGSQSTPLWSFQALREVFRLMDDDQRCQFFSEDGVLQTIQKLALLLPETCRQLKWLVIGVEDSLTLHQMQIASILANAFFCTFPKRGRGEPSINFNTLFDGNATHVEKLKCILHYFSRIHDKQPNGYVTFHRRCTREDKYPRWDRTPVKLCSVTADNAGRIEDQVGYLQMDFANRTLGGGVLGWGCVQEEIRFVICPELIAARLFTEPMTDNEACIIIGAERFCNYSGYADNFRFLSDHRDQTAFDKDQRRDVHILAVDATNFPQPMEQYRESRMLRDIKKIYTGLSLRQGDIALPLATGNWGCGVYRGDPELKSLLQIMAASQTGRRVAYFTFGNEELKNNILRTHSKLRELNTSVGQLYRILARYIKDRRPNQSVFNFVARTAENYANAYAVTRNPTPNYNKDSPVDTSDLAVKRNSYEAEVRNSVQNAIKLPRKDLPPWPRAWLEKERPANLHLSQEKPQEQNQRQDLSQNSPESDFNSDDLIPSTPDQKQNKLYFPVKEVVKKHPISLLDALEEEERKEAESIAEKRIRQFDGVPSTSFLDELEYGESIAERVDASESEHMKNEKIVCNFDLTGGSSDSPASIKSGPLVKSGKKMSQTKIDCFFKK